ncbi:MAG: methyltransferase domain-containing protein [Gammaproteobacteria bacterium]|nr:methyltransferase domain-containing protein [Gammaproteobacteria bacterium]
MRKAAYKKRISQAQIDKIRQVKHFCDSQYANLNIPLTLEFYTKRFVTQLFDFKAPDANTIISDVGAGYGWLAMAFAYCTEAKIIAVEPDAPRLLAGKKIAEILGIANRIDWRVGSLGKLPLQDRESDVVYCIEVLEHIYRNPGAIPDLCRISKDLLILTTPNLWFPVIAHDTELPFCHWLPIPARQIYAKLFGRDKDAYPENDNLFWSPYSLKQQTKGFKQISKWLHYASYQRYRETFPFYLPYDKQPYVENMGRAKALYYGFVSRSEMLSRYFVPSLACVLKRE